MFAFESLLDWGPTAWKLSDRENHIEWTAQQRAERLGLVVQNRRFLVLGATRMPNLASHALSLCLSEHENGAPVAVGSAKVGDGGPEAKREGEQTVAKRLYEQANLENAVVTSDALYCGQHQARAVIEAGGDYLF